jgi:hypothetical protein
VNPALLNERNTGFTPSSGPPTPQASNRVEPTAPPPMSGGGGGLSALLGGADHDAEVAALRRRIEALQTELRGFRAGKGGPDSARRIVELELLVTSTEAERDAFRAKAEHASTAPGELGNGAGMGGAAMGAAVAETASSLNDVLSSMRIEVMAAEGALDQYAQTLPRASYELIRQSLKDAAAHCDEARTILRKLRDK